MVSACSRPHVTLPTVPLDLLPEQRVQMFYQLYATRENTVTTTTCQSGGGCSTNVDKTLYLANGTQVYDPEDLVPVVSPDSATARAVHNVHEERRKVRTYGMLAMACMAGSFFFLFKGDDLGSSALVKVGLPVTFGGALISAVLGRHHFRAATAYWSEANESYNAGLAQRLRVCTNGLAIAPCESAPPSAPSLTPPPFPLGPPPLAPTPALTPPSAAKPLGH